MSLGQLLDSARPLLDILKHSIRRHCPCCDVGPHGSYRALSSYPSITDLEKAVARGCRRCSIVLKTVLVYSDRWKDADPSEVKVNLEPEPMELGRSAVIIPISILWPDRAKPRGTYLDFGIEMYFEQGAGLDSVRQAPNWFDSWSNRHQFFISSHPSAAIGSCVVRLGCQF